MSAGALERIIEAAARLGASDVHLRGGAPAMLRVDGRLESAGGALEPARLSAALRSAVGDAAWAGFLECGAADVSLALAGRRCRTALRRDAGGTSAAIRLLPAGPPTLDELALPVEVERLIESRHGLVLVSGPTGPGKSSTLAALVQLLVARRSGHLLTIEQPIEFEIAPHGALVRQREVGRDTPSFARALHDALREDVDVVMVGELRDRETMRLTLDACETGHLVLATLHSATCAEALNRLIAAFPAEEQPSVCTQLADALVGVLCQRLAWSDAAGRRVPECELLLANTAVRAVIRQGQVFQLASVIETGGRHGMLTWERSRQRHAARDWSRAPAPGPSAAGPSSGAPRTGSASARAAAQAGGAAGRAAAPRGATPARGDPDVIRIDPDEAVPIEELLAELERRDEPPPA